MSTKIGRTLPPAAAPLGWADLWHGLGGLVAPARALRAREDEIRRHFGVSDVFLVSSGTAALTLALLGLRSLSSRTEVVIPAYTCFSVPAAVIKAGLKPVLCDIDPSTFDFDHALLERALGPNTLGVIAHHLFGIPSDIERTRATCRARGIFVVEDAAQAMGAEANGRQLGTVGDVGVFSLGRGKNITCGSGGIIVTSSVAAGKAIRRLYRRLPACRLGSAAKDLAQLALMTLFIRPGLYWIPAALPFLGLGQTVFPKHIALTRLPGMKAGLLREWRSRLMRSNRRRRDTAADFSRRLGLSLPQGPQPYLRLPIRVATAADREQVYARSRQRGLGVSVAYPSPVNEIPEIRATFDGQRFPSARSVADSLLTIPTHHWLSEQDKRAIAELCGKAHAA
jgi:dTDP-4-amino-4,6-dideoxygalactose transaminase